MTARLPLNLKFGNKSESGLARQYSSIVQSDQKSDFSFGETCVFNIPTRPNNYLDGSNTYLKFSVDLKNGATADNTIQLDACGAHCFIDRLRILHGSNVLEDCQDYASIAKLITDWTYHTDYKVSAGWVQGHRNAEYNLGLSSVSVNSGGSQNNATVLDDVTLIKTNAGDSVGVGLAADAVATQTYVLNLFSLIGSLAGDNYIPLTEMVGAPLRVEITWKQSPNFAVAALSALSATSSDHKIYATTLMTSVIEVSDDVNNAIREANPEGLQISSVQYKLVQTDTRAISGTTNVSTSIPARYKSVKSLFATLRDSDKIGNIRNFSNSFNRMGITSYQFRIGNMNYPQTQVTDDVVAFMEVQKGFNGGVNDLFSPTTVGQSQYTQNVAPDIGENTSSGCYAIGLDLESYTGIVNRSVMYSGSNLTSTDCALNISTAGVSANMRINVTALIDVLYTFSNGVAVVSQ